MTLDDALQGIKNFTVASGANTSRAAGTATIRFTEPLILTSVHAALGSGDGPCMAHVEINPSGTEGQTTTLKAKWIRGGSVTGGNDQLAWFGEIWLKRHSNIFALVRNDTGSTVNAQILYTGRLRPLVVAP